MCLISLGLLDLAWWGGCALLMAVIGAFGLGRRLPRDGWRSVAVLVVGDLGRSPRMQYHGLSLASLPRTRVTLVGSVGEPCVPAVASNDRIREYRLRVVGLRKVPRGLYVLYAPIKAALQVLYLLWVLWLRVERPSHIIVQNPPGVPALFVVWLVCRLRGARFVVDWHNLGYTIMGLTLGAGHPMVRVGAAVERVFGRLADAGFCVTEAMQEWLRARWGIDTHVLYDRPPPFFRRTPVGARHKLFLRLKEQGQLPGYTEKWKDAATPFTTGGPRPALRADRPALIVSSTSWTPDEDFGIMLDAIVELAARAKGRPDFPKLCFMVTGKGPQKAHFMQRFSELGLEKAGVRILTMWLEASDYPLLLGAADLGICLHTSSSELDLPMKVVDMFGCGLPVCAVGFKCLPELVRHGENGLIFSDKAELASQLFSLFKDFRNDTSELDR